MPCYMYRSQVLKNLTELQYKSCVVGMPTSPLTVFCRLMNQGGSASRCWLAGQWTAESAGAALLSVGTQTEMKPCRRLGQ